MPNKDKTGPNGLGPLTGRKLGPCGDGIPRGRRFEKFQKGRRNNISEKEILENQKDLIEKRLSELE